MPIGNNPSDRFVNTRLNVELHTFPITTLVCFGYSIRACFMLISIHLWSYDPVDNTSIHQQITEFPTLNWPDIGIPLHER